MDEEHTSSEHHGGGGGIPNALRKPKPVVLVALGVGVTVAVALYLRAKNASALSQPAINEAATIGTLAGGTRTDPNTSDAATQQAYADQFGQLGSLVTSGVTGLAQGIVTQNKGITDQLKGISTSIGSLISGQGTANSAGISALGGQISDLGTTVSGQIGALGTSVTKAVTDAIGGQGDLLKTFSTKLVNVDANLSRYLDAFDTHETALYFAIGQQTGAACFGPNGGVYSACIDAKGGVDGTGQWAYGPHGEGAAAIKAKYAKCANANGFDLVCAGKVAAAAANATQTPVGSSASGGG